MGRHPECSGCYWVGLLDLGPHLPGAGNSCSRTIRPGGTPGPWPISRKRSSGGSPGPTPYQVSMVLPGTPPASHCPFPQTSPVLLTAPSSWLRRPGPYAAQKQSSTQTQSPPPSPAPQSPAHLSHAGRGRVSWPLGLSRTGLLPWAPPACAPHPRPAPSGAAGGQNSPGEAIRGPDAQWVWGRQDIRVGRLWHLLHRQRRVQRESCCTC